MITIEKNLKNIKKAYNIVKTLNHKKVLVYRAQQPIGSIINDNNEKLSIFLDNMYEYENTDSMDVRFIDQHERVVVLNEIVNFEEIQTTTQCGFKGQFIKFLERTTDLSEWELERLKDYLGVL